MGVGVQNDNLIVLAFTIYTFNSIGTSDFQSEVNRMSLRGQSKKYLRPSG